MFECVLKTPSKIYCSIVRMHLHCLIEWITVNLVIFAVD